MRRFFVRIIIFFAVVAMIDVAFGFVCRYLNSHAKGGDTQNHYYIAKECDKDILIFGSSRAIHHYDPKIIEDSLAMSCFNCGVEGNGIVYQYSRLLMMTERYTPKMIIYDIQQGFDISVGDNSKYLKWQKRFYDTPGISEVFDLVSPIEKWKMKSKLYQYNETFVQMLMDNIHPIQELSYGGYRPKKAYMGYVPVIKEPEQLTVWDSVKKECMVSFVELCKQLGIKLIFVYSPSYGGIRPSCDNIVKKFVSENNIVLLDFYSDPYFCMNKDYFYDSVHMNETGATEFTKKIVSELKKL